MMKNIQLVEHLMIELDKQGLGFGQAFVNTELDHFLNTAYLNLIESKLVKMEAAENEGIKTKFRDDLAFLNILIFDETITNANMASYEYLSEGFNAFYIAPEKESLHIYHASMSATGMGSFNCIKINSAYRKPFIWNSLNAAYVENPVFYMITDHEISQMPGIVFLVDPSWMDPTIDKNIKIYGIKRPALIDSTNAPQNEIEVPWWNEIVMQAATYALENIESQRTQIHAQISNTTIP